MKGKGLLSVNSNVLCGTITAGDTQVRSNRVVFATENGSDIKPGAIGYCRASPLACSHRDRGDCRGWAMVIEASQHARVDDPQWGFLRVASLNSAEPEGVGQMGLIRAAEADGQDVEYYAAA